MYRCVVSVCVCVCVCAGPGSIVGVCVVFPDRVMHFRLCLSVFRHSVAIISPYAHVVCVCVCVCVNIAQIQVLCTIMLKPGM